MALTALTDVWVAITPAIQVILSVLLSLPGHVLSESRMVFFQACSNYLIIYQGSKNSYGSWSNNVTTANQSTAVFATSYTLAVGNNEGGLDTVGAEEVA